VVVLVATSSFGGDESGFFEDREVLGDGLAGGAESVLHGQAGADLEQRLAVAVDELVDLLRHPDVIEQIPDVNRSNLAKYLTITRLKLENAIAILRQGMTD
jgi:hypothetical protein